MSKFILTDGQKGVNLLDSNDPSVWTFFSGAPASGNDVLYSRVAAAYRAYNLKANTVGSMPFALVDENGEDYDASGSWENKVGFLPNPSELFRLDTLSYIATNTVYNLRTSDALGYRVKGLYHAVATTFSPITDPVTGSLLRIERKIGNRVEKYTPEDKQLIRMWRLDHLTEVLPSPNTEALAIMSAAGTVYDADQWIQHFYEHGGVPPTIVAMKGVVTKEKVEDEEKGWDRFFKRIGVRGSRAARVVNAEALDVKQMGSSVTDLKNNEVYQQAIANIAMGLGMPLSLLLANSANYATAEQEIATWYASDIIPFCNWLAYGYNEQVFHPMGLHLEFRPETVDPEQEDETQRAAAISTFADFLAKAPTYELFIGMCETFGYELSDSLVKAAKVYYKDKEKAAEEMRQQTQAQPAEVQSGTDTEESDEEEPPTKWVPSLDQLKEMNTWRAKSFHRLKRGESLDFEWKNESLPEWVYERVKLALLRAQTEDDIKAAFGVDAENQKSDAALVLEGLRLALSEKE